MQRKKLIQFAKSLYQNGYYKYAQNVIDFLERKKEKDSTKEHNKKVLEDWKKEKKDQSILEQHRLDKMQLQNPEFSSELFSGSEASPDARRFNVELIYAGVDEDGRPYIDEEEGVRDFISVSAEELEKIKEEDARGFLKILDIHAQFPEAK